MYFENKNKLNLVEFKRIHLLDRTFLRYCDIVMPAYQHTLNEMQKVWYIYFKLFFLSFINGILWQSCLFFLICRKCPQFRFRYYCWNYFLVNMFEIETDKNLIQLEHIRSLWSSVCNDVRNYNATETFDETRLKRNS